MRGPLAEATAPAGRAESDLLAPMDRRVLVVAGALARRESRGSHFRTDYPQTDLYGVRTFLTLAEAERMIAEPGANAPTRSLA